MSQNCMYNAFMAGRPPKNEATELGKRLSEFRKATGLSQTEVADALGIPQRNVSFYERAARTLPPDLLKPMAALLGISPEDILGLGNEKPRKRGPKSRLERLFEKAAQLPLPKQDLIVRILGEIIGNQA